MFKKLLSISLTIIMAMCVQTHAFAADNDAIIGQLTIFASNGEGRLCDDKNSCGESSASHDALNSSGHSFIVFENTDSSSVRIGGLSVESGKGVTFGTRGDRKEHKGIWYNIESYFSSIEDAYHNRVSLTMGVIQSDIDKINDIINRNDTWKVTNNCSSFAVKVWNSVSSTKLKTRYPNTPAYVKSSIERVDWHQTERPISISVPIGYVENGSFVSIVLGPSACETNTTLVSAVAGF